MKKKLFSMLELLTVVFVIAILISLLLPSISKIKKSANSALCQKNLKDLHVLIMAYAIDHGNILPGQNINDLVGLDIDSYTTAGGHKFALYEGWNGHLMPYINKNRSPQNWTKSIKLKADGQWYTNGDTLAPTDTKNLNIMQDSLTGTGEFRMFYCPQIIQTILDPGLFYLSEGKVEVPKTFNMTSEYLGYGQAFKGDKYAPNGIPTNYMANDNLLQRSGIHKKISQFHNFGKKAMLIEGGCSTNFEQISHPYLDVKSNLNYNQCGYIMTHNKQFEHKQSSITFAHDDEQELWLSSGINGGQMQFSSDEFNKFNEEFTPDAYVAPGQMYQETFSFGLQMLLRIQFITHLNPNKSSKHLDAFNNVFGWKWNSSFTYINDPLIMNPATGKANILFGDGSVANKHSTWIFSNRNALFLE